MSKFNYEKKIYSQNTGSNIKVELPKEILKANKILDIGCGAGYFTGEILQKNIPKAKIYGIDISNKAINLAKNIYKNILFKVGSTYNLPFPNQSFDVVTLNCTIEHLDRPQKALSEVKRVLKNGGLFLSITPIEKEKYVLFQDFYLTKEFHGHLKQYDKKSLINLIEKSGFKVKKYYFSGFLFTQFMSGVHLRLSKSLHLPEEFQAPSELNFLRKIINTLINLETKLVNNKNTGLYMHILAKKS